MQDLKKLLKKLRRYEIKIRKAVNSQMSGEYKSVFKGTGLEFDDVRVYQYGDDIRTIDWNVTARGQETYIKTFKEEKDQSIFFLLDVSASQMIGKPDNQKIDIAKEIVGVLALAAAKQGSQVGLICFSNDKEKYIKPDKGDRHVVNIIGALNKLEPKESKTDIKKGLAFALGLIKKKSIVVLLSDFIDEGYESNFKALARKHDLIVIQTYDRRETKLPRLGIIPVRDKESNKTMWVNSSFPGFRKKTTKFLKETMQRLESLCKKNQVDYVQISTDEVYVDKLVELFKTRNRTWKNAK